jgi:hypothetical protein
MANPQLKSANYTIYQQFNGAKLLNYHILETFNYFVSKPLGIIAYWQI